jgi:hypothetical protein
MVNLYGNIHLPYFLTLGRLQRLAINKHTSLAIRSIIGAEQSFIILTQVFNVINKFSLLLILMKNK